MISGAKIGGYVLAGGRSSRMGREKALLTLGGKALIEHAVTKLRRVCADVTVLSSNPDLAAFAPLLPDGRPGCGPMGGMEAALRSTPHPWNLFLPVDVPFLPTAYLHVWIRSLPAAEAAGARVWIFTVEDRAQPTVALLHREVRPFLTDALDRGEYKLLPALERAAAVLGARSFALPEAGLRKVPFWADLDPELDPELDPQLEPGPDSGPDRAREAESWRSLTPAQRGASPFWFANLNTPEEFGGAARLAAALDT